jgi:hypothetical protein
MKTENCLFSHKPKNNTEMRILFKTGVIERNLSTMGKEITKDQEQDRNLEQTTGTDKQTKSIYKKCTQCTTTK